jgi:hypothetical protein
MNLTDKEAQRFRTAVNHVLEEVPKFVILEDRELPLNNRKYTYSYTQYPNELYVTLYCKGVPAYYFSVEDSGDRYKLSGWSYYKEKPMTETLFTIYVDKGYPQVSDSDLVAIIKSISSKERFVNLYTVLLLIEQTNDLLVWEKSEN